MDIKKEVEEVLKIKNRDCKESRNIKTDKFPRIQSPSSINTFKQCPRKYYYNYIVGLQTLPSIHLIRGKLAHSVLEDFFQVDVNHLNESNFMFDLRIVIMELFKKHWNENAKDMSKLGLTQSELDFYKQETHYMIDIWFKRFVHTVAEETKKIGFKKAFMKHTPLREEEYISHEHGVRGFIDAIYEFENCVNGAIVKDVHLIDYKTSKRAQISDEYKLQLAIYALLYNEKHGVPPSRVGLDFLKFEGPPVCINVDEELMEFAKKEVVQVHEKTKTRAKLDYPKSISALCKWHSGQCDFYDFCKKDD